MTFDQFANSLAAIVCVMNLALMIQRKDWAYLPVVVLLGIFIVESFVRGT